MEGSLSLDDGRRSSLPIRPGVEGRRAEFHGPFRARPLERRRFRRRGPASPGRNGWVGEAVALEGGAGSEAHVTDLFRAYGLLIQELADHARIFVSHDYWRSAQSCFVERVSMLEGEEADIASGASRATWKTQYETTPCLPVRGERRRQGFPS